MKKLVTLFMFTMLAALCAMGCSAGTDEAEVYGEQAQLLCTAAPSATGSAGCTAGKACGTVHSITGIRWDTSQQDRFQVYRNGAWVHALDFGDQAVTGISIVGSIGGPGYPPITKVLFTPTTYWCGMTGCPGTQVTVQSYSNPEMYYNQEIAIHGGWVTCQTPPCVVDFGSANSLGKKFTRIYATGNDGHFKLEGVGQPGIVSKEFALVNSCGG